MRLLVIPLDDNLDRVKKMRSVTARNSDREELWVQEINHILNITNQSANIEGQWQFNYK